MGRGRRAPIPRDRGARASGPGMDDPPRALLVCRSAYYRDLRTVAIAWVAVGRHFESCVSFPGARPEPLRPTEVSLCPSVSLYSVRFGRDDVKRCLH